jgi:ribose 5-phosphate isomerase A
MLAMPESPLDLRASLKKAAAEHAVSLIESGMIVGLGTGTTAIFATRHLAAQINSGALTGIHAFATSRAVWDEAVRLGIPMLSEDLSQEIDITIDGADEVDPDLNLIKGGGGALLREKIVAQASRREVIVVDDGKLSQTLGSHWPVPVEVLPFGWRSQRQFLESLGARVQLRLALDGGEEHTDQSDLILDCDFGPIEDLSGLAAQLDGRAGLIEHGLFLGMTSDLIVGTETGVRHLTPESPDRSLFADG